MIRKSYRTFSIVWELHGLFWWPAHLLLSLWVSEENCMEVALKSRFSLILKHYDIQSHFLYKAWFWFVCFEYSDSLTHSTYFIENLRCTKLHAKYSVVTGKNKRQAGMKEGRKKKKKNRKERSLIYCWNYLKLLIYLIGMFINCLGKLPLNLSVN